uniref:Uncharacterized protein n=1 Tax=uncultured prokaryote TaxID=198431 RepID=A0A0H5Q840_9ZZZZ|nr:hypothetical protein [uncultured prokaryote]
MTHPSRAARPSWTQSMLVLPELLACDLRIWWAPHRNRGSYCTSIYEVIENEVIHMHVSNEEELRHPADWRRIYAAGTEQLQTARSMLDPF